MASNSNRHIITLSRIYRQFRKKILNPNDIITAIIIMGKSVTIVLLTSNKMDNFNLILVNSYITNNLLILLVSRLLTNIINRYFRLGRNLINIYVLIIKL